jgi:hypothetical protein
MNLLSNAVKIVSYGTRVHGDLVVSRGSGVINNMGKENIGERYVHVHICAKGGRHLE